MMRSFVVLLTVIVVIAIGENLDFFISIAGSIFGMTNVLLLPSLAHLILVADTKFQRGFDYFVIGFACFMIVFAPTTILLAAR
jgi:hypothetical protein